MAAKHAACRGHVKLECGCKVCAVAGTNADSKGQIPVAHQRSLERFHAFIHKVEAKRLAAEKRRPKGDGKIEGVMGGRLTAAQVIREYEKRPRVSNGNEAGDKLAPYGLGYFLRGGQGKKASPFPLKSKYVGPKPMKRIKAGYRPRKKAAAPTSEVSPMV